MELRVAGVLIILGVIAIAMAAHPFVTYPMSLRLFAPRRRKLIRSNFIPPSVAVCMCAYNEESVIVAKIEGLLATASAYGPATIHVYIDGASDRTAELATAYRDRIDLVVSRERMGKTHGMNLLLARSSSDFVMFCDANVIAKPDLLTKLVAPLADADIGCTTATLVYSNPEETPTSFAGSLYWAIEERIKQIEAETVGVVGVDGASFVIRRSLYQPAPMGLIDDFYVTMKVLIAGQHVGRVDDAVVEERSAVDPVEERVRKQRITCQALKVHFALWPEIKRMPGWKFYGYVSHRLMKWMMPFFLAASCLFFSAAAIVLFGWPAAAVIAAGIAVVVIAGRLGLPLFGFVYSAMLSLYGVAAGFVEAISSTETYTVWEPAKSVRSNSSTNGLL